PRRTYVATPRELRWSGLLDLLAGLRPAGDAFGHHEDVRVTHLEGAPGARVGRHSTRASTIEHELRRLVGGQHAPSEPLPVLAEDRAGDDAELLARLGGVAVDERRLLGLQAGGGIGDGDLRKVRLMLR